MQSVAGRLTAFAIFIALLLRIETCATTTGLYKTNQIYKFPNAIAVENLAVRPDGSVLTSITSRAEVFLLQPSAKIPDPQLIYQFNGSNAVTGTVETNSDTFYVTVTSVTETLGPIPNSSQLWKITFPNRKSDKPLVTKVSDLPRVLIPNGLTTLASGKRLLSADSAQGYVFIIDPATGKINAALLDPLFDPVGSDPAGSTLGVNGLKVRDRVLYFTNTAQKVFGKIPIDPQTGISLDSANVIAETLDAAGAYDDFAVNSSDDSAFVATGAANEIEKVDLKSPRQEVVIGGSRGTAIDRPTSAAFARSGNGDVNRRVFFVATSGGQVVEVSVP
ncbi:hypothetical protein ACLMJK_001094 [Lecanora helva]